MDDLFYFENNPFFKMPAITENTGVIFATKIAKSNIVINVYRNFWVKELV
jgi:hypothetical protein